MSIYALMIPQKAGVVKRLSAWYNEPMITLTNMIVIRDPATGKVLAQERTKDDWGGLSFPGGKLEPGEAIYDSAIREAFEETGLVVKNLKSCGIIHWINTGNDDRYLSFLFATEDFSGELKIDSDEGRHLWISTDELLAIPSDNGLHEILRLFLSDEYSEAIGGFNTHGDWWIDRFV